MRFIYGGRTLEDEWTLPHSLTCNSTIHCLPRASGGAYPELWIPQQGSGLTANKDKKTKASCVILWFTHEPGRCTVHKNEGELIADQANSVLFRRIAWAIMFYMYVQLNVCSHMSLLQYVTVVQTVGLQVWTWKAVSCHCWIYQVGFWGSGQLQPTVNTVAYTNLSIKCWSVSLTSASYNHYVRSVNSS